MHANLNLPPGLPSLPLVSNFPWDAGYHSHSTTDILWRAILYSTLVIGLVEAAKSFARRSGETRTYLLLILFQILCALECFLFAAPDWGSHGAMWFLKGFESAFNLPGVYARPWVSTGLAIVIIGLEFSGTLHPHSSRKE